MSIRLLMSQSSEPSESIRETVAFTCVKNPNANVPGILQIDKEHPHHFISTDGARFFMQAYENDWLWALDMGKPDVPTVEKSLDLLSRYEFNYVIRPLDDLRRQHRPRQQRQARRRGRDRSVRWNGGPLRGWAFT